MFEDDNRTSRRGITIIQMYNKTLLHVVTGVPFSPRVNNCIVKPLRNNILNNLPTEIGEGALLKIWRHAWGLMGRSLLKELQLTCSVNKEHPQNSTKNFGKRVPCFDLKKCFLVVPFLRSLLHWWDTQRTSDSGEAEASLWLTHGQ